MTILGSVEQISAAKLIEIKVRQPNVNALVHPRPGKGAPRRKCCGRLLRGAEKQGDQGHCTLLGKARLAQGNYVACSANQAARLRATLRRVLPDAVRNDVEILGSCSMVTRRGLLGKKAGRVDTCKRTLTLLSCVRLPFERYMRACRQFAVSKVAYGWIARAPPLTLCTHLRSQVHVGSRRLRLASVWLRAALFGGGMHLDILFATQLVGILARLRRHRTLTWCTRGGSPACAFNAWLRSRGWSFDAEWKWTHADTGHTLNLNDDGHHGEYGCWQHMVRDAWRAWCLRRHMSSSRRDSALDCFHAGYFKRIDWAATRAWAASCAEARSVCVGALFSPAARGGRGPVS